MHNAALRKRDPNTMTATTTNAAALRTASTGARPTTPTKAPSARNEQDGEDTTVDFANASLYLSGFQTVFTICCCAVVSVLACWVVPEATHSN